MTGNRVFLDIHAIQVLPPSNVNRDDTGSPKTAVYGGVRRARVSSQSWKRAMRKYFVENMEVEIGIRSSDALRYVADIIEKEYGINGDEALEKAETVFKKAKIAVENHKLKAPFFLGRKQAGQLAKAAVDGVVKPEELKPFFCDNPEIDIALFGRMVAGNKALNEDASSQVAHAISTHEVRSEFDYYTALDELASEDSSGADMIGNVEYNSSTLYRYANIALHDLAKQLGDKEQAVNAAKLFIQAFANSMPTGKINTFANQTLPQLLVISVRRDRPVSLVTAFENPVKPNPATGYGVPSINSLFEEMKRVEKFVEPAEKTFYVTSEDISGPAAAKEADSLTAMLKDFAECVSDIL